MTTLRGPRPRLLTGHLAEFRADRLSFFTHCARTYGDMVPLRLGRWRILLLSHPDLIEEALVTQANHFIKHFGLRLYEPVLGKGLVTSEGSFWRRQRKLSAPAFQGARLSGYAREMVASAERMLDTWRDGTPGGEKEGTVRDVHADMTRLTLEIACRTLFGADACPDPDAVGRAMTGSMEAIVDRWRWLLPLPSWFPTPTNLKLRRSVDTLDRVSMQIIARRRAAGDSSSGNGGPRTDLLSALLQAQDDDGSVMTDRQLLDEVRTILLAGHETTALALTYCLHLLSIHPDIQHRVHAEVSAATGDRPPAHADLPRLTFTRNVVTESMRVYPPADFLGREVVTDDCTIGGIPVPRGTNLFMSQWVMHRDPRYFPDPDAFNPDRWTEAFEESLPRFAYFPFGGGPRYCVGQTFATTEAVLVLAALCRRFRFAPQPGFRLELWPNITLRPRHGLPLVVRAREPARSPQPV